MLKLCIVSTELEYLYLQENIPTARTFKWISVHRKEIVKRRELKCWVVETKCSVEESKCWVVETKCSVDETNCWK